MSSALGWWQTAREGRYAEMESEMLAVTDRGEGYFPDCEVRGSYYENWGDMKTRRTRGRKFEKDTPDVFK